LRELHAERQIEFIIGAGMTAAVMPTVGTSPLTNLLEKL